VIIHATTTALHAARASVLRALELRLLPPGSN